MEWIELAEGMVQRWAVVQTVMNLLFFLRRMNFLNGLATFRFSNVPVIDGSGSARNMTFVVC